MSGGGPKSVLFVCNLNAIRSPMAEQLTNKHFHGKIFAESAGVETGYTDSFVGSVMEEVGLSLADHEPTTLKELDEGYFDLIVALSERAYEHAKEYAQDQAVEVEFWPTDNPSTMAGNREQALDTYRKVRDDLQDMILKRFSSH